MTSPNVDLPSSDVAAPTPTHERVQPPVPSSRAFEQVPVLGSTAVHGGWGACPADHNTSEHARWSERFDELFSDASARRLLRETLREFEPRERVETLRMPIAGSVITDSRVVRVRAAAPTLRGATLALTFAPLLLALVFVARLPVASTSRARGVLQSSVPGQALTTTVSGIVRELTVTAGARVNPGQTLAVIDPVDLRTQLAQTLQGIEQIEQRQGVLRERQTAQQRTLDGLRAQAVALRSRYDGDGQRMARLREQRRSYERLVEHGFASRGGLDDLSMIMQGVWRDVLGGEQDIASNKQQQLAIEQERRRDTQGLQTEMTAALATRHDLEAALERGTLVSPALGRFDGPLVKIGERVESGQLLGRVVPLEASMRAMLEVSTPEHVQLRVGAPATLRVEEPGAKARTLKGRISAINTLSELKPHAGELDATTTTMRVEVVLNAQAQDAAAPRWLAPGTHVTAALSGVPRALLSVALEEWSAFTATL